MKKQIMMCFALAALMITGCGKKEEAATPAENRAVIQVNTDGLGQVSVVGEGEELQFNDENPVQSSYMNVETGTVLIIGAKADEGWQFVKWTKDGSDYSAESEITVTVDENTEYIAVFSPSTGYEGPAVDNIEDAKTIGDILALPSRASGFTETVYIYGFELNGTTYQALADLNKETSDALFALDFNDPDYQTKYNEIVAPLEITKIINLTELIPSQEELDKLVGKTGQDLLDDGWTCWYHNAETEEFGMYHTYFSYIVKFNEHIEHNDDLDMNEEIRSLTVASVQFEDYGDTAWIEQP